MSLKYIGQGKHIIGVPAQDLDDAQLEHTAVIWKETIPEVTALLINSGLYKAPQKQKASKQIKDKD